MYIDKEYAILEILSENEELSQRQLSKLLDISLGSVNLLINKMQREGLIKFRNISANSIAYMLTPKGIAEKANKTYRYITYHYKKINDTKEKIREYMETKVREEEKIYLVLDGGEMSQIVKIAISEMKGARKIEVLDKDEKDVGDGLIVLVKCEDSERFNGYRVETVLERI